jgi:hypothetical protein
MKEEDEAEKKKDTGKGTEEREGKKVKRKRLNADMALS